MQYGLSRCYKEAKIHIIAYGKKTTMIVIKYKEKSENVYILLHY